MTEAAEADANAWLDRQFVDDRVRADRAGDLLDLPRRMAAAIVATDRPGASVVVDVASGPGAFLAAFLDELASARGVWSDASDAMLDEAHRRLAVYGDRVEFLPGDMTDLVTIGLPSGVDVVLTSRAAHNLDREGLIEFYASVARLLAPGGWLVDLDHIGPDNEWDRRFRSVRPRFVASGNDGAKHHHNYPLTSVQDHLDGFARAGIDDVEVVWRAFYTCLFMGRVAPSAGSTIHTERI